MSTTKNTGLPPPLESTNPPPMGRFCDLIIEGGVINGVAYSGFLVEVARRFHLHSVGGASVGAIAASLAVACEYGRRFGSLDGYNEGLRKLPKNLAEIVSKEKNVETTRIRSLFQPTPALKSLFDFALNVIEESTKKKPSYASTFYPHFLAHWYWIIGTYLLLLALAVQGFSHAFLFSSLAWALWFFIIHPLRKLYRQIDTLRQTQGFGMCSGMPVQKDDPQTLTQWAYTGIQDAAGLPYARPLTFGDLWLAPGGPIDAKGNKANRSIDLRTVTSCLNHGRVYELPLQDPTARIFFRLSEFKKYFPQEVIDYLRGVSETVDIGRDPILQRYKTRIAFLQNPSAHSYTPQDATRLIKRTLDRQKQTIAKLQYPELKDKYDAPDIRELPSADLPIVIAARLSLSVPILFQAIPMLAFDLECNAEDMELHQLWFSDGGIRNNFPIQMFDKALPQYPTFGVKVLETNAKKSDGAGKRPYFLPYYHDRSTNDIFVVDPEHKTGFGKDSRATPSWSTFASFLMGIYQTAKDGEDQAFLRMPSVRNRVLRLYTDHATGSALNLNIKPEKIYQVAKLGAAGGRGLVEAYLGERQSVRGATASMWIEHRWVRFNLLVNTLRKHLSGFEMAAYNTNFQPTIFTQINQAISTPPLQTKDGSASMLSTLQAKQLEDITQAIIKLERTLTELNLPLAYVPMPESKLQISPKV